MKVLASVYACSPYDGSERAVGWNWIRELDKYHEITALTCHVYKKDIEDYISKNPGALNNTSFVYIDVPNSSWHVGYRLERLYYILWQNEAYKVAKELIAKEHFDLVHHITYVTCILPTKMYNLGIPFLYGPVSGGENTPAIIHYPMNFSNKLVECIRTCSQRFFRMTPGFARAMKNASVILATTEETKQIIPRKYHDKVEIFQAIGLSEDMFLPEPLEKVHGVPRFLMAGRMLYWKGFELGIRSFVNALNRGFSGELVVLGDTENKAVYEAHREYLKNICGKYLDHEIQFVSKIDHSEMKAFYDGFDVLINCSLRDSGCFVVMEAMSRGIPVIVVNTGGPKVNTAEASAIKIDPAPMNHMIDHMEGAIIALGSDRERRCAMGSSAREYAYRTFLMENRTLKMCAYYDRAVSKQ